MVFATAWALYASCCGWTVQGGDAGEFMVLAAGGGVAHPPGYPLFVAALRLFGLLPLESVPFKASLAAATFAAAAVTLLEDSVRRLTGHPFAGLVAAMALGLSPTFWRYATVAEVFTAGTFTAMLVLAVIVRIQLGWSGWKATLALGLAVATPERFVEKANVPLMSGRCWTVPALAGGRLYVRDEQEIVAVDLRGSSPG